MSKIMKEKYAEIFAKIREQMENFLNKFRKQNYD